MLCFTVLQIPYCFYAAATEHLYQVEAGLRTGAKFVHHFKPSHWVSQLCRCLGCKSSNTEYISLQNDCGISCLCLSMCLVLAVLHPCEEMMFFGKYLIHVFSLLIIWWCFYTVAWVTWTHIKLCCWSFKGHFWNKWRKKLLLVLNGIRSYVVVTCTVRQVIYDSITRTWRATHSLFNIRLSFFHFLFTI